MGAPHKAPAGAKINELLVIPPDYELGPAMKKLNERQRAFVIAMLDHGGIELKRCAIEAGYPDPPANPNYIRVQANRLAHDPTVQEAIREEGLKRMNSAAIAAPSVVMKIMNDTAAEPKDRLKAAEMIMNRIGMNPTTEHKVTVTHKDEDPAEMVKRIEQLMAKYKLDSQKALEGTLIEAEYEEVDENSIEDLL